MFFGTAQQSLNARVKIHEKRRKPVIVIVTSTLRGRLRWKRKRLRCDVDAARYFFLPDAGSVSAVNHFSTHADPKNE
jgi:hypothetical protein